MRKKANDFEKQAQEVLKQAEEKGVATNYFFATTFERYQTQLLIMKELEKEISKEGALVEKEYVKGRKNVYTNPAITEYNKTATASNNTVSTLINIIKSLSEGEKKESKLKSLFADLDEE